MAMSQLFRAGLVISNVASEVSVADVPVVEDLRLHVLEVPVADELVGRQLHNGVSVVRHAEEAIAEPCVEVLGPDLVSCARHAKVVQLFDLVAVAVQGHGGEAGESRSQRGPRHPRGFLAGAALMRSHGLLDAGLQALELLEEATVHLAIAASRPSGARLVEFEVSDEK